MSFLLIKGGEILEKIGTVDTVLLDKTGTITVGKPAVKAIRSYNGWHKNDLLAIAVLTANKLVARRLFSLPTD